MPTFLNSSYTTLSPQAYIRLFIYLSLSEVSSRSLPWWLLPMSSYLILFQLCTYPLLFFTWLPGFIFFMALINIQNHLIYFYLSPILEYKLYDSKDLVFLLLTSQCLRSNIYSMNQNQTQYTDYGNAKKLPSKFIILKTKKRLDYLHHKL